MRKKSGWRITASKIWKKASKIPHLFSKLVVTWCILVATLASAMSLVILYRTGSDATGLLAVILGFFGGELLIMCLRAIIGKRSDTNEY